MMTEYEYQQRLSLIPKELLKLGNENVLLRAALSHYLQGASLQAVLVECVIKFIEINESLSAELLDKATKKTTLHWMVVTQEIYDQMMAEAQAGGRDGSI